ncbi:hypothetical protein Bca4012_065885 [Brassica carinata]
MGYLIGVEESEDDIEPEFRRMLQRMHEKEEKLREEKFKVLKSGIKLEEGQSSKGMVARGREEADCLVLSCSHGQGQCVVLYSCVLYSCIM